MRVGDCLVVWKLDRLARSLKQLIQTVEALEKRGMRFLSLTEAIDTSTSGGKLIFYLFASLAEFERSLIQERTMAGLRSAKKMGRLGGRPSSLKATDLAMAKTLLKDCRITVEDIARRLNVASSTLYRYFPGRRSGLEDIVIR